METSGVRSTGADTPQVIGRAGRAPWRIAVAALVAGTVLLAAGCSDDKSPSWQGGGQGSATNSAGAPSPTPTLSTVAVTQPAADADEPGPHLEFPG
jgi:hypothetical protein